MNKSLRIVLLLITLIPSLAIAQKKLKTTIFQDENSAITEIKTSTAKINMDKAFRAYADNELEKSKYFIDQSQRQGVKTGDFYFLLGAYMYRTEEYKAAKRYWKIAYKEGGCWECKAFLNNLEDKNIIKELISEKVTDYIKED